MPASSRFTEHRDADQTRRLAQGPVDVGRLIGRLTRPALGKRGLAGADIVRHWPAVVGAELAALACPLQLKFERGAQTGTLIVRVASSAAAALLQFKAPQMIERINRFAGCQTVSRVQITSGALPKAPAAPIPETAPLAADAIAEIENSVGRITSPAVRTALGQLGIAVRRRNASRASME